MKSESSPANLFKADLHIHSKCSDGTLSPLEILHLAKEMGVLAISITDHDTVQAYTGELFEEAEKLGIRLITGVEFSCMEKEESVHVLGYGMNVENLELEAFCQKHIQRREERNKAIIEKLKKKGFKISYEELENLKTSPTQVLGRPHIAHLLLQKGHVDTLAEAFERYLGDGKSCFVVSHCFSVQETIDLIHKTGGKAVLAHPHLFKRKKFLKEVLKNSFDGVECYYAKVQREQAENFVKIAREKGWFITGGSDFHGESKAYLKIGSSYLPEEEFQKFILSLAEKS